MRDVIIIGAGGGGPVVAKELAARGLDVLLLEAGARNDNSDTRYTHFEDDMNSPTTGRFRFGPSDRTKPAWGRELAQRSAIAQVSGVGGTTLHYFGNCPRAMPGVFTGYNGPDKNLYDTTHLFPFTYEEFRKYYEWTEATLPVQTAAMGTKEEVFFRGCEAIGLPVQKTKDTTQDSFRPQENAVLQPGGNAGKTDVTADLVYPKATGCTFCGYCLQGCNQPKQAPRNLKAKRSTDNSYVPMALTADLWKSGGRAVTLITDAFATRIHTTQTAEGLVATAVTWRDTKTGLTYTEDARVIVMATGCIENPRLWLNSGLPNPNGWVGRGITDHAFDWVVGVMPFYTGSSKGVGSSARADFPGRGGIENITEAPGFQGYTLVTSDSGIRGAHTNGRGVTGAWTGMSGRTLGLELKSVMENVDNLMNMLIMTDDDVESQNRVAVSSSRSDEHGPVPRVFMAKRQRSARTLANREFLANKAAEILRGAGATKVIRVDWAPLMLHIQSSMRTGTSSDNSVLDGNCEARAVKRLFIGDHSALPNSLGGPNPTLTSQALATRTAEKIFQLYFGGSPWVGHERPVSSIDNRVTSAVLQRGIT